MPDTVLEIHNTKIHLFWADPELLDAIDAATSYANPVSGPPLARLSIEDPAHIWDGWYRFLRRPKTMPPSVPTGMFGRVVSVLKRLGRPFTVEDRRKKPEEDIPRYMTPIPLFDYQEAAVRACIGASLSKAELEGQGVIDLAPRGGKTRILLEVHRRIDQPTIWIAPTGAIVDQTASVAREWFHPSDVVVVNAKTLHAASKARLAIATASSAIELPKSFYDTREALVLDEFHHFLRNNTWGKEITKKTEHIYFRFGATGTHYRSGGDDLAMEAILSRVLFKMTSLELLERGRLVPTHVVFIPVPGKLRGAGPDFITGFGRQGIHEHPLRNALAAGAAVHLQASGRAVLVIVGTKRQGYELKRLIEANVKEAPKSAEFGAVEFVSRDRPRRVQKKLFASFSQRAEVKVLIGTSLIGEGVDLPSADALVWARGEQAAVSLRQGWYRVSTAMRGKENAIIVDFADRHHPRLLEHAVERLNIAATDPLFQISVLFGSENFAAWCARFRGPEVRADRVVA